MTKCRATNNKKKNHYKLAMNKTQMFELVLILAVALTVEWNTMQQDQNLCSSFCNVSRKERANDCKLTINITFEKLQLSVSLM